MYPNKKRTIAAGARGIVAVPSDNRLEAGMPKANQIKATGVPKIVAACITAASSSWK